MAHPLDKDAPIPGEQFEKQQGTGQGTTIKRRRNPRKEVNDVSISQADGLSLGEDGNFHPIETDREGNLKVRVKGISDLLQEMVGLQRATLSAIAELADLDFDDLVDEFC